MPALNFSEYPVKIPPAFKAKVLARLLPPLEVIKRASADQLRALHERKVELERLIDAEPVRFFLPNPGAQADFMEHADPLERVRIKLFLAGNKSGKSTAAAILASEFASGELLWGRDHRRMLQLPFPVPNRGVYYADDFDAHKQTTVPTLLSWLPRRLIKGADRNSMGYITDMQLTNGSLISFKTYDQGYAKAEGKDWSWAVCDEPPPREIYTGIRRGLVVMDGILVVAATLLTQPWLWDEVELSSARVYNTDIYSNAWISGAARDEYVESLSSEEREIRVKGRPVTVSGVVYKDFRDDAPWVVPFQHRYWDPVRESPWPAVLGVDPHERVPLHLLWFWLTPSNGLICFDWALVPNRSVSEIFEDIRARERQHAARTALCVMDPNRGGQRQLGGRSWADEFEANGFSVVLGDDNLDMGHSDVRDMLMVSSKCPAPRLVFQENCRGKGGPIHALTHYAWDDWSRQLQFTRDPKEKPREKYKHFPDVIRYVVRGVVGGGIDFETLSSPVYGQQIAVMKRAPMGRSFY